MARHRALHADPGPNGVELLSELAGEGAGTPPVDRSSSGPQILVPLVAIVGLGLMLLVGGPGLVEPEEGRAVTLEFRFGDAFAIDWAELPEIATAAPATRGPQPMIGTDGRCLGFGRSDWPAWERHPSVAHCLDPDSIAELDGPDVVGVHRIAAGPDAWYYLFFAGPVTALDIDVEPAADSAASSLHRADAIAAIRVPTSVTSIEVDWRFGGDRYRVAIGVPP